MMPKRKFISIVDKATAINNIKMEKREILWQRNWVLDCLLL